MPTERRFAPPPNNILAGFTVTVVPSTTPCSYATPLPPSISGPTSEMGTKSSDGHASLGSSDMASSLGADGDIL